MKYALLLMCFSSVLEAETKVVLDKDVNCFAAALYFESRGEILAASVGVAELLLTRIKSNYYGNTACDVIKRKDFSSQHQKIVCQFEWFCNLNKIYIDFSIEEERRAWHQALVIAESYLSNTPPNFVLVDKATLFHDKSIRPWWASSSDVTLVAIIGNLYFYQEERNGVLICKTDGPPQINVRS